MYLEIEKIYRANISNEDSVSYCIDSKIDYFMHKHVLHSFNPEDIFWWLSLSGGKDSYTMAKALKHWYDTNGYKMTACGLTIDQWGNPFLKKLNESFQWLDLKIIDAKEKTLKYTKYQNGRQAPCRECADVRRTFTNQIISANKTRKINFIARGLHLSDTAVSLLWRYVWGRDPFQSILEEGKYHPLKKLWENSYLVKPLFYMREFETQRYAILNKFQPLCCGCPACHFPSRRDIVEETIVEFFRTPLWEFNVPGVINLIDYFAGIGTSKVLKEFSMPGTELKSCHLPEDFNDFVIDYYRTKLIGSVKQSIMNAFNDLDLDKIGTRRLCDNTPLFKCKKLPIPALLKDNRVITDGAESMITALGPFWGAIGLVPPQKRRAFALQEKIFGIKINQSFSHVIDVLNIYYRRKYGTNPEAKNCYF
jgi:tRNA(Ile)-lysidine synthase TilS/MesJ